MFRFHGFDCEAVWGRYPKHQTAMRLVDAVEGFHIVFATAFAVDNDVGEDELLVRDWLGSEDIIDVLCRASIIKPTPVRSVCTHFRMGHVFALTPQAAENPEPRRFVAIQTATRQRYRTLFSWAPKT